MRHSDNVAGLVDLASPRVSATPASQQLRVLFRCRQTRPGGLGLGLDSTGAGLDLDSVSGLQPLGDPVDLPDYVIRDFMQLRSWLRHTALSHLVCGRLDALTLSRTALSMNIRQSRTRRPQLPATQRPRRCCHHSEQCP